MTSVVLHLCSEDDTFLNFTSCIDANMEHLTTQIGSGLKREAEPGRNFTKATTGTKTNNNNVVAFATKPPTQHK
jgi:hypothetical protein